MKRSLSVLLVFLVLFSLFSCLSEGDDKNESDDAGAKPESTVKMTAKVIRISDVIEVDVIEGEYGASGIYWVLASNETEIFGKSSEPISLSAIKVDDTIEIIYGGQVMMSYPPKIVAHSIRVL
jgi:hypothetical protein